MVTARQEERGTRSRVPRCCLVDVEAYFFAFFFAAFFAGFFAAMDLFSLPFFME
jgi:hypothetical protein